ncbi:hypothetical protein [Egicoccus sp. AB-alg2]|uniref:hypothetical protein n=1 Tax=Egicoccus sp. AB-alg2 TaxID=3242693 RepID=UPI00359CFA41
MDRHSALSGPSLLLLVAVTAAACSGATAADRSPAPAATSFDCDVKQRTLVVGASGSEQSESFTQFVHHVTAEFAASSLACGTEFVVAMASGSDSAIVLAEETFASLSLDRLPNERARQHRIQNRADELRTIVDTRLNDARQALVGTDTSSVVRLYDVAAERTRPGSRVVLITDGVHTADEVDLNRVLEPDEGPQLAGQLPAPSLPVDVEVTISGLTQVDATTDVPGDTWTREVVAFNDTFCRRVATTCTTYTAATVQEALGR